MPPKSLPIELPPSPFVAEAATFMPNMHTVLDLGSCTGRNSLYMARLGHRVIGITHEVDEATDATELAMQAGLSSNCQFIAGDIRQIPLELPVGVAMINETLHMLPKREANDTIANAMQMTRRNGLHIVSGYVINAATGEDVAYRQRYLVHGELANIYDQAGWKIIHSSEDGHSTQVVGGKTRVLSLARILAQKR